MNRPYSRVNKQNRNMEDKDVSRVELTHGNGNYPLYALFRLSHRSLIVYLYGGALQYSFFQDPIGSIAHIETEFLF
ncbi:MAG: hypothetical protein ACJAW0_000496 [Zhongshania sp.]|jgi:hypothetical protein